jgi:hypothetical protein
MNIFLSRNDKLRLTTLKACFVIGKHRKPFSDGEFIKLLVLAVEPENRLFRDVPPLSNDTVQRRIQELCIFIRNEIAQCVNKVHSLGYVWMKVMILQKLHKLLCVFVTSMRIKI